MSSMSGQSRSMVPEATVGGSYGHGFAALKKYFLEVLLITLVVIVITSPYYFAKGVSERSDSGFIFIVELFALGFWLLILGPLTWGADYAMLKAARNDKPEILDIFIFQKNYINVVLAHLLSNAIVLVGLVFLIVPGIILACRLAFVPYLVTDRRMEATEAIRESWHMTSGHGGTIFLMGLLAIPVSIAGALLLGVGIILAVMWISLAFASIYAVAASMDMPHENV